MGWEVLSHLYTFQGQLYSKHTWLSSRFSTNFSVFRLNQKLDSGRRCGGGTPPHHPHQEVLTVETLIRFYKIKISPNFHILYFNLFSKSGPYFRRKSTQPTQFISWYQIIASQSEIRRGVYLYSTHVWGVTPLPPSHEGMI